MLETAHRTVPGFRIARIRKVARPAAETARSACLSAGPAVPFRPSPPLGVVAPHRIPRLAAVACLARYASSLAGVTFSPAQPPSVINSPCEKTNLTQKQPYVYSTAHENVLARKSAIASHPNVNVSCLMRWRLAMAGARGPHAPRATALGATGSPAARFVCPSVPPSPRRALPF